MKVGLVLEGGGLRGVFAAAAVDFFIENNIYFPYIIGTSSGALNGICLKAGQIGRAEKCLAFDAENSLVKKLLDSKKKTTYGKVFGVRSNKQIPYDIDAFLDSDGEFEINVTDCDTGAAAYLSERSSRRRLGDILRAASALPAIDSPVEIDGCDCIDGYVADPIPFEHAFLRGCDKVVVVLTSGIDFDPEISSNVRMLYSIAFHKKAKLYKALCDFSYRYKQSYAELQNLEKEGKALVIRPDIVGVGNLEADRSALEAYYSNGRKQVRAAFPDIKNFIY